MRPVIATQITQHTLWQALTGEVPPQALGARPIANAVLDNRDAGEGDLFVALRGQYTDGHNYIGSALENGVQAILCEEHGREQAIAGGATVVACVPGNAPELHGSMEALQSNPIAYVVPDSQRSLQRLGAFQRLQRCAPGLRVTAITGSVGKSSTKELAAAVLGQRFNTLHSPGSLNNEQGLPFTLLGLGYSHERAVLEMGTYGIGEIAEFCTWARPHVGVITNIGPVHLERMGTMERIAQAKAELVQALPPGDPDSEQGGVAILNWDDERVRPMAEMTDAHIFRYGLSPDADLWADEIQSEGINGIRFQFHYREPAYKRGTNQGTQPVQSMYVRVPLLGRHSVHTALRAAAVGLVEGLSWAEIISALQRTHNHLRLVVVPGINGSTVIDDTYNASPASTIAALNLLADLAPEGEGRRIAVLGDMLELGSFTDEGHQLVGRRAADVVDILITVGELGRSMGEAALSVGFDADSLHMLPTHQQTVELLRELATTGDLLLIKGSRAVGMDTIAGEVTLYKESGNVKP